MYISVVPLFFYLCICLSAYLYNDNVMHESETKLINIVGRFTVVSVVQSSNYNHIHNGVSLRQIPLVSYQNIRVECIENHITPSCIEARNSWHVLFVLNEHII